MRRVEQCDIYFTHEEQFIASSMLTPNRNNSECMRDSNTLLFGVNDWPNPPKHGLSLFSTQE
jgi:hypothetical protein